MADKLKVPEFASEAEEAQWWYDNRDQLIQAFEDAAARGEMGVGSAARLARERAAGEKPTTIRLDAEDVSRAHSLAAKRGVQYQAYLKTLLHEALEADEKKLAS